MSSNLKVNTILPSTGTNVAIGTAGGSITMVGNIDIDINSGISTFNDIHISDKIIHDGDTDTQIRFPSADTITAETGGTERFRITSSGLVGIGTNIPSGKLNLVGSDSQILNIVQDTGDLTIRLNDRGSSSAYIKIPDGSGALTFENGGSEKLRIESGGNIGIGTDNPNNLLHVFGGQIKAQSNPTDTSTDLDLIRAQCGSTGNALFSIRAKDAADNNSDWDIKTNANENLTFTIGGATERLRIASDGKIGIGITNPAYDVDFGESAKTIRLVGSSGGTAIRMGAGGSSNDFSLIRVDGSTTQHDGESDNAEYGYSLKYMGSRSGNENCLSLFSDNQSGTAIEAITVLQDAKVGLGTAVPAAKLDVRGDTGVYIRSSTNGNGAKLSFTDSSGGGQVGTIEYKHQDDQIITGTNDALRIGSTESRFGVKIEGLLKIQQQPCAVVYQCTGPAGGAVNNSSDEKEPLHFDHVSINQGNMTISQNNGRIQVPVSGIYFVSYLVSGTVTNVDQNDGIELILLKNGSEYPSNNSGIEPVFNFGLQANAEEFFCNNTILVSLTKDDYVEVALSSIGSSDATINRGNFCVMLMA